MAIRRIQLRACETDAYPVGVLAWHFVDAHDATPANTNCSVCGPEFKRNLRFTLVLDILPDSQTNGPPESPLQPELLPFRPTQRVL